MDRSQLPASSDFSDLANEVEQQIHLVNPLVDQRTSAFSLPTPFQGPRIVFGRTIPFHIRVGLQNTTQAATINGIFQKADGIIEPTLG